MAAAPPALVAGVRSDTDHAKAAAGDAPGAVAQMPKEGVVRPARMAVAALGLDAPHAAPTVRKAALRAVGQAKGGAPRLDALLRADPPPVVAHGVQTPRRRLPRPNVGGGPPREAARLLDVAATGAGARLLAREGVGHSGVRVPGPVARAGFMLRCRGSLRAPATRIQTINRLKGGCRI